MNEKIHRRDFLNLAVVAGALPLAGCLSGSTSLDINSEARPSDSLHPRRKLPYPRSEIFRGLEWLDPAKKYPGTGSDMHWWTWGEDGDLYAVDGDGSNFGQKENFAHLLRISGIPPVHKVQEISLFPELAFRSDKKIRYVCGALAVGKRLYVAAYDYNYSRFGDAVASRNDPIRPKGYNGDGWYFDAIAQHGGVASLMYSDDGGRSWSNVPDESTPYFLGPRFAALAFVGFGPGYSMVPSFLGDYVYAISNDENWESGNGVFLARVPKEKVLEREAWEFYAGSYMHPGWSKDESEARPVLTDPGHVGHPTMSYNAAIKRFILAFGSDAAVHSHAVPRDTAVNTWHRERELCIYEGPTPWGPWGLVHYESRWEGQHVAYLPQLPSKWFSDDGLSGTILFSGDYSYFYDQPPGYESFYGFITRPFRLIPI